MGRILCYAMQCGLTIIHSAVGVNQSLAPNYLLNHVIPVTAAPPVCSTEHTCGPTLQTDHIRPSSIFYCRSHSVEQSSCRIQRPDNQRCLLPTAFKDSSVRTTASAPLCLARARFVYDYALYKFTFIIIIISRPSWAGRSQAVRRRCV